MPKSIAKTCPSVNESVAAHRIEQNQAVSGSGGGFVEFYLAFVGETFQ